MKNNFILAISGNDIFSEGEWVLINGNQTCLIFLWYIITNRQAVGKMKLVSGESVR